MKFFIIFICKTYNFHSNFSTEIPSGIVGSRWGCVWLIFCVWKLMTNPVYVGAFLFNLYQNFSWIILRLFHNFYLRIIQFSFKFQHWNALWNCRDVAKVRTIFIYFLFAFLKNLTIFFFRALRERTTAVCLSSSDEENEASDDDEWD